MYAIVRDRGMQYRVEQGRYLDVALLDGIEPGSEYVLGEVLLVSDGESTQVGTPTLSGAVVKAEVLGELKGEKILVFRYQNKKRFRRRKGHRQKYTRLKISEIVVA